ncbi:MAG: cohesin domain-containing protein [Patescibacteria group bacterium]
MKLIPILCSILLISATYLTFYPTPVSALSYDLIAPSGTLNRGDEVQFIINIDSDGTTVKTATVGMTYESQYIQFVSATPGDAMDSVTSTPGATGTLMLTGINNAGLNGSGVYAYVTFKIIATAAGTTELCALFNPTITPTPAPVTTTAPVVPTALPVTGSASDMRFGTILGSAVLLLSLTSLTLLKRSRSTYSPKKH